MVGQLRLRTMTSGELETQAEPRTGAELRAAPHQPFPRPGQPQPQPWGCSPPTRRSAQMEMEEVCQRFGTLSRQVPPLTSARLGPRLRLNPIAFSESIEINLSPLGCNSTVRYGSDRRYRDGLTYASVPVLAHCRETVMAVANCTWRHYRSELLLEPRLRPHTYHSSLVVFPKHVKHTYRTTLTQRHASAALWYTVSVRLEAHREDK